MDRIILKGMKFYGYHGVSPRERELGGNFVVDVELYLDLKKAGREDDISLTVDYSRVFGIVKEKITCRSYNLLEAAAEEISSDILKSFPVRETVVGIKKINTGLEGSYEYMGVEIRRQSSLKQNEGKGN
ncbi:MAG TPA: dihydroneopterin aldolase [Desulfotomaculum sp.]|nr:MAG: Dihydroneopterin aldolase [Desulfotomaculum sp. 46_80]HAG10392.1 dihydroneopterin aldolase [Desulfotomaculum sp.]HBY04181.1 dihydroneopterin aldolase [Desulfotomaculum sp.]